MQKIVLFCEYMKQFEGEDSPRGDFARDMRDSPMPELLTYNEMLRWLRREKFACKEAVEVFKECYAEYKKEHKYSITRLYAIRNVMNKQHLSVADIVAMSIKKQAENYKK